MGSPKRVLHVIRAMDRGGAETLIMNLYRSFDREAFQFDFLVNVTDKRDYDDEIRELGGHIYRVPQFLGYNLIPYRKAIRSFFAVHHDYVAVHGHIGLPYAIYLSEAKRAGMLGIAHVHAQNFPLNPAEAFFRMCSNPVRHIADYFIACSEQAGLDRFGTSVVHGDRFHILKNGIELDKYQFDPSARKAIRDEIGIPQDAPVIGHIGRLIPVKNHPFLFDVFKKILTTHADAHLVLAGRGESEEDLKAKARALSLESRIHFLGVREDIPKLLSAMDVFVFPSIREGLPLATIEAQACGLPCVISTGIPNMAQATHAVTFLPLNDGIEAWAKQVNDYLNISRSINRYSAVEQVRQAGFDINDSAAWLQELYMRCKSQQ